MIRAVAGCDRHPKACRRKRAANIHLWLAAFGIVPVLADAITQWDIVPSVERSDGAPERVDATSCCAYTCLMVRTQIQLTEQQARSLRAKAHERGLSLAEVIRRYVEKGLADEAPDRATLYERAARLVGTCRDRAGKRDVSAKHDRYLDEAFK